VSLVIDASVAIKWFFHEELRDQALAVIDLKTSLVAPDLFRAEFANVLWKKVRRTEVSVEDATLLTERIDTFVKCIPTNSETARIALSYAVRLNSPAYDCFYLALAEQLGTKFVTADRRFAEKVVAAGLGHLVTELDRPIAPVKDLLITQADLNSVIALSQQFDATVAGVYRELTAADKIRFVNTRELQPAWDSPAHGNLRHALALLSDAELKELAALAWLGRGYDGHDFAVLKKHADTTFSDGATHHIPYITSLLRYVESGIASLKALHDKRIS
jgi:predicted nucleic acid-binding protein